MSGLAFIAPKTLLEQIIFEVININLKLNLTSSTDHIIGLLLVFAGLIYNFFYYREENKRTNLVALKPEVVAKITTVAAGNMATVFNIELKNLGQAVAKNIHLKTNMEKLKKSFASTTLNDEITNCFTDRGLIPVIEPGKVVTNGFGLITTKPSESTWIPNQQIKIEIIYQDIDNKKYKNELLLKFDSDKSFAGSQWGEA